MAAIIILTRAAACFEYASQNRDAAHAYSSAGSILSRHSLDKHLEGELFCRAAFRYKEVQDFWASGSHYRFAGDAFSKFSNKIVNIKDPVPPLPMAAHNFSVAGRCYSASSDSFLLANDIAWASGSNWLSSEAYLNQGNKSEAYTELKKALILGIRFYKTHEPESMRRYFPMSDAQRKNKINAVSLFENVIAEYCQQVANNNGIDETDTLVIASYHDFIRELKNIGNYKEARDYYFKIREREQESYKKNKKRFNWCFYWLWGLTCGYGDSMKRWIITSLIMMLFFSIIYYFFGLIEPVNSWVDYPYFSIITLTSLGYGDIHPSNVAGKIIACIEIVFGLFMFGMLVTMFSKRVVND